MMIWKVKEQCNQPSWPRQFHISPGFVPHAGDTTLRFSFSLSPARWRSRRRRSSSHPFSSTMSIRKAFHAEKVNGLAWSLAKGKSWKPALTSSTREPLGAGPMAQKDQNRTLEFRGRVLLRLPIRIRFFLSLLQNSIDNDSGSRWCFLPVYLVNPYDHDSSLDTWRWYVPQLCKSHNSKFVQVRAKLENNIGVKCWTVMAMGCIDWTTRWWFTIPPATQGTGERTLFLVQIHNIALGDLFQTTFSYPALQI